jgi:hypothetical protein
MDYKEGRSLPISRLRNVFAFRPTLKALLGLQGSLTRGALPNLEHHGEQTNKRRGVTKDPRKTLKKQRKKLKRQAQQIKEEGEKLRQERLRNRKLTNTLRLQSLEIFQLRNELRATKERAEGTSNDLLRPQGTGELETGALPDFLIIGGQKCGTTSLYHLLTQHPHVERAPLKEVHFFDRQDRFDKGIEWYRRCFPPPRWKDGRRSITGEASPYYLLHPHAAQRVAELLPEARLIVLLRNPVDRAYSQYHHRVRNGNESRSFEEVVEADREWLLDEENEPSEHWRHSGIGDGLGVGDRFRSNLLIRGFYVDQLQRWSQFFDDEQMLVLNSEDFFERPSDILKLVLDFLDLPDWKPPAWEHHNRGDYEQMDPAARRMLEAFFEPYNRRLYEYLGVDFGW